jgi:hypothetical protein
MNISKVTKDTLNQMELAATELDELALQIRAGNTQLQFCTRIRPGQLCQDLFNIDFDPQAPLSTTIEKLNARFAAVTASRRDKLPETHITQFAIALMREARIYVTESNAISLPPPHQPNN